MSGKLRLGFSSEVSVVTVVKGGTVKCSSSELKGVPSLSCSNSFMASVLVLR